MPASLSCLSFLRAAARVEDVTAAIRGLLLHGALVLPCDLTETERDDLCDLICLFAGMPVQVAARARDLRTGHVCLLSEPVQEDPEPVGGSIVLAVRAPAAGRRRLDASRLLRDLRGALLQAIATRNPDSPLSDIAGWAEHVADSPVMALRFAAAAHAASLAEPHAPESEILAEGLADVIAWLFRGVDPRVAEWVFARALPARNPSRLISTEAAILGETAALQRALAAGLVEHLPEEADDELDLRRPLAVLRALEDLPVPVELAVIAARLKSRITPQAHGVIDRWLRTRPRPLRLHGPLLRPDFTGRTDVMARLVALFEPSHEIRTAVVYGMPGLGKSAFGAALGHRLSDRMEAVWLTFLDGPEAAWRRVADALRMDPAMMRSEPRIGAVPAWLRHVHARMAERDALLVVDDVQGVPESDLPAWLPRGEGSCAVLVLSTRAERVLQRDNDAIAVPLRPLDAGEAKALLSMKVPGLAEGVAQGEADRLLERLGGHPSAIGLVASLLQKTSLAEVGDLVEHGTDSLRGVVRHAVESLDGEERAVAEALSVAARVGSPRALVARMLGEDEEKVGKVVQRLADRAIVELGARTVKLHGVVQLAIETTMEAGRRRGLEDAHARDAEAMMKGARTAGDEETRDEVVADVMLALGRMGERCNAGEEEAAGVSHDLAWELVQYPRGERAEMLEAAIAAYETVLTVWTPEGNPEDWAICHHALGEALCALPTGDRTKNLQRAIQGYRRALSVCTKERDPVGWAGLHNNIGNALRQIPTGDHAANLREALDSFEASLSVCSKQRTPALWAMVQNNLGAVFIDMRGGDPAEIWRRAVEQFERALTVYTRKAFPTEWAMTQSNWGVAMGNLPVGDRTENQRRAIVAFEEALTVYTEETFPVDWAQTQLNLGLGWSRLKDGDRADNLHHALEAIRAAMRVLTRDAFPWMWAQVQYNLATVLAQLPTGRRRHNLQSAVDALRGVLTVHTAEAFPEHHATTQATLDAALAELAALGPPTEPPPPFTEPPPPPL